MRRHAEQFVHRTRSVRGPVFDFSGQWKNELGSQMVLMVSHDGTVNGQYKSAVSGAGGETPWMDLSGTTGADLICFAVNWDDVAITSWVGHGVAGDDGPEILTLWQLVQNVPDIENPEVQWKTIMAGADNFFRP
jgi:hypothetical protein